MPPGLRRYVENHAFLDAYTDRGQTHDGWSELWFDSLAALHDAAKSAEWQSLRESGAILFAHPIGVGVAPERIQKDTDWTYNDWGANTITEEEIHQQLLEHGYTAIASDPEAPNKIKAAAAGHALAVWTNEHLVTIDSSRIDARPDR